MTKISQNNKADTLSLRIKEKPDGVKLILDKLSVSSPDLKIKLEQRQCSSRGEGSGCENTMYDTVWDTWDDKD